VVSAFESIRHDTVVSAHRGYGIAIERRSHLLGERPETHVLSVEHTAPIGKMMHGELLTLRESRRALGIAAYAAGGKT
jgi:hypothetical protein